MGMMDIFKKAYDRQEAAQAVYDKATETEKEVLRNEYSEMMNEVENACENSEYKRAAIQLWHAYETMRERGNKYMDFDMVDEDRAAELAHAMKEKYGTDIQRDGIPCHRCGGNQFRTCCMG